MSTSPTLVLLFILNDIITSKLTYIIYHLHKELNINANVLVTYRTSKGGKGEMTYEAYMTLLKEIIKIIIAQ